MTINNAIHNYQQKQLMNYTSFIHKLTSNQPIRIVCQGDSMTYGQDTFSGDRRPAKSDPTCEEHSTYSYHDQAGKTYPEALQEYINQIFPANKLTIINRGYSGDWAGVSKTRWKVNPEADLHFLMLGTNDSSTADHVPKDIQQNLTKYTKDMCMLIEQILDFPSSVVLLTPPKHANETDQLRIIYRRILQQIGVLYNIPVIDTTNFHKEIPYSEVQSDGVHYNSLGYSIMAAKIAGILANIHNIYEPFFIHSAQNIEPSLHYSGITIPGEKSVIIKESESAPFGVGSLAEKRLKFHLPPNSKLLVSFHTTTERLAISPQLRGQEILSSIKIKLSLDFGVREKSISISNFDQINSPIHFNLLAKGPYSILLDNQSTEPIEINGFKVIKMM